MPYPNMRYRDEAVAWANTLLQTDFVVLDTETTGIMRDDEVVSVGLVDSRGEVVIDTLVRPSKPIPWQATRIHGLTDADVANAPTFGEVYPALAAAMSGRALVVYNLAFDLRILDHCCKSLRVPALEPSASHCAMQWYARYYGGATGYGRGSRWQKLTAACSQMNIPVVAAHSAVGDCLLTLEVIRRMAASGANV